MITTKTRREGEEGEEGRTEGLEGGAEWSGTAKKPHYFRSCGTRRERRLRGVSRAPMGCQTRTLAANGGAGALGGGAWGTCEGGERGKEGEEGNGKRGPAGDGVLSFFGGR